MTITTQYGLSSYSLGMRTCAQWYCTDLLLFRNEAMLSVLRAQSSPLSPCTPPCCIDEMRAKTGNAVSRYSNIPDKVSIRDQMCKVMLSNTS